MKLSVILKEVTSCRHLGNSNTTKTTMKTPSLPRLRLPRPAGGAAAAAASWWPMDLGGGRGMRRTAEGAGTPGRRRERRRRRGWRRCPAWKY